MRLYTIYNHTFYVSHCNKFVEQNSILFFLKVVFRYAGISSGRHRSPRMNLLASFPFLALASLALVFSTRIQLCPERLPYTRAWQCRKVLWVWPLLDRSSWCFSAMAGEIINICSRVLKENNKSRFDTYFVKGIYYNSVLRIISQLYHHASTKPPATQARYFLNLVPRVSGVGRWETLGTRLIFPNHWNTVGGSSAIFGKSSLKHSKRAGHYHEHNVKKPKDIFTSMET